MTHSPPHNASWTSSGPRTIRNTKIVHKQAIVWRSKSEHRPTVQIRTETVYKKGHWVDHKRGTKMPWKIIFGRWTELYQFNRYSTGNKQRIACGDSNSTRTIKPTKNKKKQNYSRRTTVHHITITFFSASIPGCNFLHIASPWYINMIGNNYLITRARKL